MKDNKEEINLTDHNGEPVIFRNHYICYNCKNEWEDDFSCQPDDDCGACGTRHISPHNSEDLCPITGNVLQA